MGAGKALQLRRQRRCALLQVGQTSGHSHKVFDFVVEGAGSDAAGSGDGSDGVVLHDLEFFDGSFDAEGDIEHSRGVEVSQGGAQGAHGDFVGQQRIFERDDGHFGIVDFPHQRFRPNDTAIWASSTADCKILSAIRRGSGL